MHASRASTPSSIVAVKLQGLSRHSSIRVAAPRELAGATEWPEDGRPRRGRLSEQVVRMSRRPSPKSMRRPLACRTFAPEPRRHFLAPRSGVDGQTLLREIVSWTRAQLRRARRSRRAMPLACVPAPPRAAPTPGTRRAAVLVPKRRGLYSTNLRLSSRFPFNTCRRWKPRSFVNTCEGTQSPLGKAREALPSALARRAAAAVLARSHVSSVYGQNTRVLTIRAHAYTLFLRWIFAAPVV